VKEAWEIKRDAKALEVAQISRRDPIAWSRGKPPQSPRLRINDTRRRFFQLPQEAVDG
jgi:hypothetical protein